MLSTTTQQTMSSLEIAKLTGKRHSDVLETVRNVLNEAEINSAEFSAEYKDKSGKANVLFHLH
jgi:phage regulator Rha-like protein